MGPPDSHWLRWNRATHCLLVSIHAVNKCLFHHLVGVRLFTLLGFSLVISLFKRHLWEGCATQTSSDSTASYHADGQRPMEFVGGTW